MTFLRDLKFAARSLVRSKGLTLAFCSTLQISNGKIVGGRDYYNVADLMQQLGLMPETAAATA